MTRYIQVVQGKEAPKNKQARELLEYAHRIYGFDKFDQRTFTRLLADQKGKDTALKGSKADPAQTWNYYRPALHYYGHIKVYEGDTAINPEPLSTDPFNRKPGTNKSSSLADDLAKLEQRIKDDTAKVAELKQLLERANQSAADMTAPSGLYSATAPQQTATDAEWEKAATSPQGDEAVKAAMAQPSGDDAGEIPEHLKRNQAQD